MDIESAPRRFTKEGPFQTIGRRARNPPKKSRDGAAAARDRPTARARPARETARTRAPTHTERSHQGQDRRGPRQAPEPARKKLEEIEKTTGQPKSLLAGGGALFGLFLVFFLCPPQLVFSAGRRRLPDLRVPEDVG